MKISEAEIMLEQAEDELKEAQAVYDRYNKYNVFYAGECLSARLRVIQWESKLEYLIDNEEKVALADWLKQ